MSSQGNFKQRDPAEGELPPHILAHDEEGQRLQTRHTRTQRILNRIRLAIRVLHIPISIASLGLMAFTLAKYFQTQNLSVDNQSLWPPPDQTMLWPTILTLVVDAISAILAAVVIYAWYSHGHDMSGKWDNARSAFDLLTLILIIVLSSVVGGTMYATGQATGPGPQSLWRVACNVTSDLYQEFIDLDSYCLEQNLGAWLAFVTLGVEFITLVSYTLLFLQWRQKAQLKRHESIRSTLMSKEENGLQNEKKGD